jgi:hypothetical protein
MKGAKGVPRIRANAENANSGKMLLFSPKASSKKQKFQRISPTIFASREFGISSAVWDLKQMSGIPNSKKSGFYLDFYRP